MSQTWDWSCLPVHLLCKLARQDVTVALSGDGGDEMFVGYPCYFPPLDLECRLGEEP